MELYPDKDVKRHILNSVSKVTPRGFRIIKDVKSKKIDIAIALAMATYGMTQIYTPPPKPKQIIHYDSPLSGIWVEEDKHHPIMVVERF